MNEKEFEELLNWAAKELLTEEERKELMKKSFLDRIKFPFVTRKRFENAINDYQWEFDDLLSQVDALEIEITRLKRSNAGIRGGYQKKINVLEEEFSNLWQDYSRMSKELVAYRECFGPNSQKKTKRKK